MGDDVLFKLSIAKQYVQHADFAGTPRQAIADGYSAIDAVFSALLIHLGIKPPRNHKQKLDLVRKNFPNVIDPERICYGNSTTFYPGTHWTSVESFYGEWLASRYDNLTMSAGQATARVHEAHAVISGAIRFLARERGVDSFFDLETTVAQLAFGYEFSEISTAVGEAHEHLFQEAEVYGEMHGAKLGTKLAATTNFCSLDLMSGDDITRSILKDDIEVATEAAKLYHQFIQLVDMIDNKRLAQISGGKSFYNCTKDEQNNSPDFMLAMKARYHGSTMKETAERWAKAFARLTEGRDGYGGRSSASKIAQ